MSPERKLRVGLSSTFRKTVSEADVYLFAGITGDFGRMHVDEEFARGAGTGGRVAHGAMLVGFMSAAAVAAVPDPDPPIVSMGYDRIRFVHPVRFGDTVEVHYQVVEVDEARGRARAEIQVKNQEGITVAAATHVLKILDSR